MRHDSPGLGLDDAMNGCSSEQGRDENIHLAPRTHSWDIAAGADTGCRQEQGAASSADPGLEAVGKLEQDGGQPLSVAGNWLPVLLILPPGLFDKLLPPGNRRRPLGTRNGITAATGRNSDTFDSTSPARRDWRERCDLGICAPCFAGQVKVFRVFGMVGIGLAWEEICGREVRAGLDGRTWFISPRASLHPRHFTHESCSRSNSCDDVRGASKAKPVGPATMGLFPGGQGAALRFLPTGAMPASLRSSRHGMLESIPPWIGGWIALLHATRTHLCCFVEYC